MFWTEYRILVWGYKIHIMPVLKYVNWKRDFLVPEFYHATIWVGVVLELIIRKCTFYDIT